MNPFFVPTILVNAEYICDRSQSPCSSVTLFTICLQYKTPFRDHKFKAVCLPLIASTHQVQID